MNDTNKNKVSTAILIGAVIIAGTVALTRKSTSAPSVASTDVPTQTAAMEPMTTGAAPTGQLPPGHPALPADHPSMAGTPALPPAPTPTAGVTWKAPPRWEQVPHMSVMRIATYRIPHVAGDAEDAELSVTRAGGDSDANIDRWLGQFDEAGRKSAKRSERIVDGLRVILVEVEGAYSGMDSPEPSPGFAMKSAIVETPGTKHFFKMTGPAKTVAAAREELQALVDSIRVKPATTE